MANWFVNEDVIDKYLDGVSEWSKLSALQADYRWVRIPPPSPFLNSPLVVGGELHGIVNPK